MKISRKSLLIVATLLCMAASSLTVYGAFWPQSNVVHIDMQYTTALTSTVDDSEITLNAAVTNSGVPVRADIVVDFYYSFNGGGWTHFAAGLTDANGVAQAVYTVTENGGYDFRAIANIP